MRLQEDRHERLIRCGKVAAFTLIEILVVVAIIALLIAILLPSLAAAREQARRAACSSNLHQQGLGMVTYAADFRGCLPPRGYWSYDLAETEHEAYGFGPDNHKTLVNIGLLHGDERKPTYTSYIGKEWKVLYCPNVIDKAQETLGTILSDPLFGWFETRWDGGVKFTYAGYDYALPVIPRTGNFSTSNRSFYPLERLSKSWLAVAGQAQGFPVDESNADDYRYKIRFSSMQVTVMDFGIGGSKGLIHKNGLNALYSDGHVRYVHYKNQNFSSSSPESYELWLYVTTHP